MLLTSLTNSNNFITIITNENKPQLKNQTEVLYESIPKYNSDTFKINDTQQMN